MTLDPVLLARIRDRRRGHLIGPAQHLDRVVADQFGIGAFTVQVTDDIPTARPDADSVTEDGATIANGNVLTGSGGNDLNNTDGVADTQGADGATVTALQGGTVGTPLVVREH